MIFITTWGRCGNPSKRKGNLFRIVGIIVELKLQAKKDMGGWDDSILLKSIAVWFVRGLVFFFFFFGVIKFVGS